LDYPINDVETAERMGHGEG